MDCRYRAGGWTAVVGPRVALLVAAAADDPVVAACWRLIDADPLELLGAITGAGLRATPDFAIVGGRSLILRGVARARFAEDLVTAAGVSTWREVPLEPGVAVVTLDSGGSAGDDLPLIGGVVRAGELRVTLADVAAEAAGLVSAGAGGPPAAVGGSVSVGEGSLRLAEEAAGLASAGDGGSRVVELAGSASVGEGSMRVAEGAAVAGDGGPQVAVGGSGSVGEKGPRLAEGAVVGGLGLAGHGGRQVAAARSDSGAPGVGVPSGGGVSDCDAAEAVNGVEVSPSGVGGEVGAVNGVPGASTPVVAGSAVGGGGLRRAVAVDPVVVDVPAVVDVVPVGPAVAEVDALVSAIAEQGGVTTVVPGIESAVTSRMPPSLRAVVGQREVITHLSWAPGRELGVGQVLAVRCGQSHLNPEWVARCRVCEGGIPRQEAEVVVRPALGALRFSTGDVIPLDRGVLVGRAPDSSATAQGVRHVLKVSADDISRTHVEVRVEGWRVLVVDLGSRNGTTVTPSMGVTFELVAHQAVEIEPWAYVALSGDTGFTYEVEG